MVYGVLAQDGWYLYTVIIFIIGDTAELGVMSACCTFQRVMESILKKDCQGRVLGEISTLKCFRVNYYDTYYNKGEAHNKQL